MMKQSYKVYYLDRKSRADFGHPRLSAFFYSCLFTPDVDLRLSGSLDMGGVFFRFGIGDFVCGGKGETCEKDHYHRESVVLSVNFELLGFSDDDGIF